MAKSKSENNIQEKDTKVKSSTKKTKKVETLEHKDGTLEPKDEPLELKDGTLENVKVDVEIDLRSYNHSDVVGGYIRRKRSI